MYSDINASDVVSIKAYIQEAFAGVPAPDNEHLVVDRGYPDDDEAYEELVGADRAALIGEGRLFRLIGLLGRLTPEEFQYLMPVLLIHTIDNIGEDDMLDALAYQLYPVKKDHDSHFERKTELIARLTPEQRRAIAVFWQYIAKSDPGSLYPEDMPQQWARYL